MTNDVVTPTEYIEKQKHINKWWFVLLYFFTLLIVIVMWAVGLQNELSLQKATVADYDQKSNLVITNPNTAVTPVPTPTARTTPEENQNLIENLTYKVSLNTKDWNTFINKELGFSFKYPVEWGTVKETIANKGTNEDLGESGKTYKLTFSNVNPTSASLNNLVFGTGKSADYTASRGSIDTDYKGDASKPKGVSSTVWAPASYCNIPVSGYTYFGRIDFNLPGKEISGIRLFMPLISREEESKILAITYPQDETLCTIENAEQDSSKLISEVEKRNLDELSKIQIKVFEQILESSKVY